MKPKVRITKVSINNIKNIINGSFSFPSARRLSFEEADVIGIYGQNGSGKTGVVDVFQVLHFLLFGRKIPNKALDIITKDCRTSELSFTFIVESAKKEMYEITYNIELQKYDHLVIDSLESEDNEQSIFVSKEEIRYKEMVKGARSKTAIKYERKDAQEYTVYPRSLLKTLRSKKEDLFITYKVNAELSFKENTSFLFRKEGISLLKGILNQELFNLIIALYERFAKNLFIIHNIESNLVQANIVIPIYYKRNLKGQENGYGEMLLSGNKPEVMSVEKYNILTSMFTSISKVLKELVPGLTIELRSLGKQTLKDGNIGIRAELIAKREDTVLPFSSESDGIKKLVSILSSLIVMYNDENACVVIDELDAGIFEFLLGELVKILNDSGKGQLLFTSHNLRLLEVLEKDNLVFTTTNPFNRYINLKGIKETNNIRDVYIRAIQLGNDGEPVYVETNKYDIMDAFEEAGEVNNV